MSFNSRLKKLEETTRGGSRCSKCGLSGDPAEAERIVVTYDDEGALGEALPEPCPECGRPEVTLIRVVYEGAEEGEGSSVDREM